MSGWSRDRLGPIVDEALARIQSLLASRCRAGFWFGAIDIHPRNLAVWIVTDHDAERDALAGDLDLKASMRAIFDELDYPAEAIADIGFEFESEETVERDWGGDWWAAVK